jgi:predicted nuclease of predicted toxin-antitoxin system
MLAGAESRSRWRAAHESWQDVLRSTNRLCMPILDVVPWRPVPEPEGMPPDWRKKVRILVDESLGPEVAAFVSEKGWNAVFAGDVGLAGKSDTAVAAYAWRKRRMIWTHDRDYLDERILPEHRNPGVVVLPGGDENQEAMRIGIGTALSVFGQGPALWSKSKTVISPTGEMTVRSRDPDTGKITSNRYRMTKHAAQIWER